MPDQDHDIVEFMGSANPFKRTPRLRLMAAGQLFNQDQIKFDSIDELLEAAAKLEAFVAGAEEDADPEHIIGDINDAFGGYL